MLSMLAHPLNASPPIYSTKGIVTDWRDEQLANTEDSTLRSVWGNMTFVSEEQPLNSPHESCEIPSGTFIASRDLQSRNAELPNAFVTVAGITSSVNAEHPLNAEFPIVVTVEGISMFCNLTHPLNNESGIRVKVAGKVTDTRFVNPEKAPLPNATTSFGNVIDETFSSITPISTPSVETRHPSTILMVSLFGSIVNVRFLQPLNALAPMFVTAAGITRDVREVHPLNASEPMVVTDEGIVNDVSPEHPAKAEFPIVTTPSGNSTSVNAEHP
jgi:hypothetical protein